MRIKTFVSIDREVEVDITLEDVISTLGEMEDDVTTRERAARLLNTCLGVIMRLPDEVIATLSVKALAIIAQTLSDQASRYGVVETMAVMSEARANQAGKVGPVGLVE